VFGNEIGAGRLVTRRTALHYRRFASANVRPTDDARLLH